MLKNQQFWILKFSSDRLKKSKYSIDISIDNARINGEIITINNSELIRTLFRYKKIEFDQFYLENLLREEKKLKKLPNNEINKEKILEISKKIEKNLFVEDLISVEFKHRSHYLEIVKKKGFYVNGTRFVPFMASAGMIRKNTALFINNNLKHPIMDILENGRNESTPMVAAKFGAYFSLYSSSTLPVSFPKFAVIPDKEIETLRKVDFVEYVWVGQDDDVTRKDYIIKANAWDGQGLIKPSLAEKWSEELDLGYVFSSAIIRAPFLKGLVVVFDLDKFAQEVSKKKTFIDLYGIERNIDDYDLIISESMFKLWNSYENTESYVQNCHHNKLGFSVSKTNPMVDKSFSRTSYQFLQILNLSDMDIANLCEPTIDWFRNTSGENPIQMLIYATGENNITKREFEKLETPIKALIVNPDLSRDSYIQNRFIKTIAKKKKESFMGSLLVNANYQFMISDPYYQACHMFGLTQGPLLKENEYYSEYWNNKGVEKVAAIRSPIVHHSEFNALNLTDRDDTKKWYQHIHSGIIFPANGIGIDCVIHGGSDFDGDLICTINNPTMIKGKIQGIPIVYESKKSEKTIVNSRDDLEQVTVQLNGHNSKVGFATNISSSMYAMVDEYKMGSRERELLFKRLTIGRAIQGEIIDGVKGLEIPPFREHWTKRIKPEKDVTPEELEQINFYNKMVCETRPAFFRFLYPHYMSRYNKEIKDYNIYSELVFGKSFESVMRSKNPSPDEQFLIDRYKHNSFFLDNNSPMNKISRYMRSNLALVAKYSRKVSTDFDYSMIMGETQLNMYKMSLMREILNEYKAFKKNLRNKMETGFVNLDAFILYLRKKCISVIGSNESELADYAIQLTYGEEKGMVEFPWRMFPDGIYQNVLSKSNGTVIIPVADDEGDIEYLWSRYRLEEVNLEDIL